MIEALELAIGITEISPDLTATVTPKFDFDNEYSDDTSDHEATHAWLALRTGTWVKGLTILPDFNQGYLGATFLTEGNAVAASGPAALGHRGVGHDLAIVVSMGHSTTAAEASARSYMIGHEGEIHAIAVWAHKNKSLTGSQIVWAREEYKNPELDILLATPEGTHHLAQRVRKGAKAVVAINDPDIMPQ